MSRRDFPAGPACTVTPSPPSAARAAELVGGAAIEWLAGYFGELVTEVLGQGVPDEAHQTAYAEIGLLLHLTSPPARRRWERHRQTLSAELARAYRAEALHRIAADGPLGALVGQLAIRLGIGPRASETLDNEVIAELVRRRSPCFPSAPVWKPVEMAFMLEALGLTDADLADDRALLAEATDLLGALDLIEPAAAYALTHLVFYGTRAGKRACDQKLHQAWVSMCEAALAHYCEIGHMDLLAELLEVLALLDRSGSDALLRGWDRLAGAQAADGSFPVRAGPAPVLGEYHRCLVAVLAAQFTLAPPSGVDS